VSEVRRLRLAKPEPNKDVIETIEELLAKAKSGELKAIGFCMIVGGGFIGTGWTLAKSASGHEMLSAITVLQHRFISWFDSGGA
jgi:hypothetical protein